MKLKRVIKLNISNENNCSTTSQEDEKCQHEKILKKKKKN
jgi:hypothetical protein